MKYLKILCTVPELHCLFPEAELLELYDISQRKKLLKIKSEENVIDIEHHMENPYEKLSELKDVMSINSLYINPIENLTIICDRQLWYRFYFPLLKNHKEEFDKLEKVYVEKNVQILFNFAILEAVNYEDEEDWFLYDFKFKHIKLSDYELFENKKNFYYNSFFGLYHILSEGQLDFYLFPNMKYGYGEYFLDFKKFFDNFHINNRLNREYIYSHMCLKPRYHRINFLLEADKNKILVFGKNTVNTQFIEEYKTSTQEGVIYTDSTKRHNENHKKYFTKEYFEKFLNIINKIKVTSESSNIRFNHAFEYFKNKEYEDSYIEVSGETHCIFDLKYGFFTEKSYKAILGEKFGMIYGSSKVYSEFKKIGINLFLDEFELNGIENKNELEQIQMIVNS